MLQAEITEKLLKCFSECDNVEYNGTDLELLNIMSGRANTISEHQVPVKNFKNLLLQGKGNFEVVLLCGSKVRSDCNSLHTYFCLLQRLPPISSLVAAL